MKVDKEEEKKMERYGWAIILTHKIQSLSLY
jgi:hypothetical protein